MKRVGVIAALPGELKPLVKGWIRTEFARGDMYTKQAHGVEMVAVQGGMGRESAAAAFMQASLDGPLSAVISLGWAGALSPDTRTAVAYRVTHVVDASTGERYVTVDEGCAPEVKLVTAQRVASGDEKARLAAAYGAVLVDMEAATVARLARVKEIPFYCYKAVTDAFEEVLPDMNRYIGRDGKMNLPGFAASVLVRPRYWPALMRMGRNSREGAAVLAAAVTMLEDEWRDADRE